MRQGGLDLAWDLFRIYAFLCTVNLIFYRRPQSHPGIYRDLAQSATVTQDRYSKSEIKFKGTVNVMEIQERADQLAKECRELDAAIQEAICRSELL